MIIAAARLNLHLPQSHSLKDKRRIVKSMVTRLQNEFHVTAAEIEDQDVWQVAVIGIAYISSDASHANSVVSKAVHFIETGHWDSWLSDYELEIMHVF